MPTQRQIIFLLSGGVSNNNPDYSLGGEPSTRLISNDLNNLFRDLTKQEVLGGYTDYRCFYIKNTSNTDWTNLRAYIKSQSIGGATCMLGVELANDLQQISIMSDTGITGGYFTLKFAKFSNALYDSGMTTTGHIDYSADPDTWATNFRAALIGVGFFH